MKTITDEQIARAKNKFENTTEGRNGFYRGCLWYRSQIKHKCNHVKCIPFQVCPICMGNGRVATSGSTSAVYTICDVCDGRKIIPMYPLPQPPKPNNESIEL